MSYWSKFPGFSEFFFTKECDDIFPNMVRRMLIALEENDDIPEEEIRIALSESVDVLQDDVLSGYVTSNLSLLMLTALLSYSVCKSYLVVDNVDTEQEHRSRIMELDEIAQWMEEQGGIADDWEDGTN